MTDELGYYNKHKERLLREFDRTASLMEESLVLRFGKEFAKTLQREIRLEYEKLIPLIPYIRGVRAGMFNSFLIITAQELAVYKGMTKYDRSPVEAWELCDQALRLRLAQMPSWKRWLIGRLMFSGFVKRVMKKRAQQNRKDKFGNFEVEYLGGKNDEFDFGINYLQCGNYDFVLNNGGEKFAPYVCMSDIALSDVLGWGLIRTQTLADGCLLHN